MARNFQVGDIVTINTDTKARDQYGQPIASGDLIESYSKARVVDYNDKSTESVNDDVVKIKIISGDSDLKGKTVWVNSSDFKRIKKVY